MKVKTKNEQKIEIETQNIQKIDNKVLDNFRTLFNRDHSKSKQTI